MIIYHRHFQLWKLGLWQIHTQSQAYLFLCFFLLPLVADIHCSWASSSYHQYRYPHRNKKRYPWRCEQLIDMSKRLSSPNSNNSSNKNSAKQINKRFQLASTLSEYANANHLQPCTMGMVTRDVWLLVFTNEGYLRRALIMVYAIHQSPLLIAV